MSLGNLLSTIYCWIVGHILYIFMYEKKYRNSRFFKGKYLGLKAPGWKWTISDFRGRFWHFSNRGVRYPVSPYNTVNGFRNIYFSPNNLDIFRGKGRYFQAEDGYISIGEGTHIANNTCLVTTNHDLNDPDFHQKGKNITIGNHCWLGFGSIILPGVTLGDHTVVGAGSVVTKSFLEGYVVIAGNPAKVIKVIQRN